MIWPTERTAASPWGEQGAVGGVHHGLRADRIRGDVVPVGVRLGAPGELGYGSRLPEAVRLADGVKIFQSAIFRSRLSQVLCDPVSMNAPPSIREFTAQEIEQGLDGFACLAVFRRIELSQGSALVSVREPRVEFGAVALRAGLPGPGRARAGLRPLGIGCVG